LKKLKPKWQHFKRVWTTVLQQPMLALKKWTRKWVTCQTLVLLLIFMGRSPIWARCAKRTRLFHSLRSLESTSRKVKRTCQLQNWQTL
jgi:hypothetical protein